MNYEELIASRKDGKLNKTRLPIGEYYRQQIDGKYRSVVDIFPDTPIFRSKNVAVNERILQFFRNRKDVFQMIAVFFYSRFLSQGFAVNASITKTFV